MDRAEYLSTAVASGGNGLYPLSTQGLSFIQNQITLLQGLARIGGKRYILCDSSATTDGIVVIDGEVLPLKGSRGSAIRVVERSETITADGTDYREARVYRYAEYTGAYRPNVPGLYPSAGFLTVQSNDQLAKKLQEYSAVNSELARKLTVVSTASLTRVQLDAQKDNVRINCRKGCFALNGAEEYTINVYRHSANNITQEQILPDLRRYVRYWDSSKKAWGGFFPVTENLHIDVKVSKGSTVYIRHGFIPEGVQLVLLRKKKRSRKRRSGGTTGTNAAWQGKSALRQPKNQYVHYKGVILSTSSPNNWYVPKCVGVTDKEDNNLIGKELGTICSDMIVMVDGGVPGIAAENGLYKVVGTRVKASAKGNKVKTQACCYARIALQFAAAGKTFKSAGGEMAKMKYRLWFHLDKKTNKTIVRRGFSAD